MDLYSVALLFALAPVWYAAGYLIGFRVGHARGQLAAIRRENGRVDTLLHRWRTEQRP